MHMMLDKSHGARVTAATTPAGCMHAASYVGLWDGVQYEQLVLGGCAAPGICWGRCGSTQSNVVFRREASAALPQCSRLFCRLLFM